MEEKIRKLLKDKNAILLAHNYQPPQIQDVADLCGDSLELSIKAAQTDADLIVFCGVHFMAETASILSPQKTVLLPRPDAGCPMADMIDASSLQAMLKKLPDIPVVTYVNSPAAVKALSTICCTSANAVEIVGGLPAAEVLMTPDRNLAQYTASKTGKRIHMWPGYCPFHEHLTPDAVTAARHSHPGSIFMAHPECRPDVLETADVVASTSGMIRYAAESTHPAFIVGTEIGLLHPLRKACPDKTFFPASEAMRCDEMKKISLQDIFDSLTTGKGEVQVPPNVQAPAWKAVQRMIDMSG